MILRSTSLRKNLKESSKSSKRKKSHKNIKQKETRLQNPKQRKNQERRERKNQIKYINLMETIAYSSNFEYVSFIFVMIPLA